jgi:hypothetical protein
MEPLEEWRELKNYIDEHSTDAVIEGVPMEHSTSVLSQDESEVQFVKKADVSVEKI